MNRRRKRPASKSVVEQLTLQWHQTDWLAQKTRLIAFWQQLPKRHQRLLMILVPSVVALSIWPTADAPPPTVESKRIELAVNRIGLSEQTAPIQTQSRHSVTWHEYVIRKGDTLAQAFRANNLPMSDLTALVKVEGADRPLSHLKQGQLVRFKLNTEGQLEVLELNEGERKVLFFRTSDGGFGRER